MLLCLVKTSYYYKGNQLEDKTNTLRAEKQRDEDSLCPQYLKLPWYYT